MTTDDIVSLIRPAQVLHVRLKLIAHELEKAGRSGLAKEMRAAAISAQEIERALLNVNHEIITRK